jgi:hypothetical protein
MPAAASPFDRELLQTGGVLDDWANDGDALFDGPPCPACGVEMQPDGVDTAEGLESCHRCPRCKLVLVIPGF